MTELDGVMRALSDGTRRQLLIALREEDRITPFDGDGEESDRAIQLHHVHLPILETNGIVRWNRDRGTVKRGDDFEAVEPILAALEDHHDGPPADAAPTEGRA